MPRHKQHCTVRERWLRRLASKLSEAVRQEGLGNRLLTEQCYAHVLKHYWPPSMAVTTGSAVQDLQAVEAALNYLCHEEKQQAMHAWREKWSMITVP